MPSQKMIDLESNIWRYLEISLYRLGSVVSLQFHHTSSHYILDYMCSFWCLRVYINFDHSCCILLLCSILFDWPWGGSPDKVENCLPGPAPAPPPPPAPPAPPAPPVPPVTWLQLICRFFNMKTVGKHGTSWDNGGKTCENPRNVAGLHWLSP